MDGKKKVPKKTKSTLLVDTTIQKNKKSLVDTTIQKNKKSLADTTIQKSKKSLVNTQKSKKSLANTTIQKRKKTITGEVRRKTRSSFGSTKSNKVSDISKGSNKNTRPIKKNNENLSNSSSKNSKESEHKPKRNFSFPRNPSNLEDHDEHNTTHRKRSSNASRRHSKGSGRGKNKGSFSSHKEDKKGIPEEHGHHGHHHKTEHDGHIVSTAEEIKHSQSDDESKSKLVHFQLRYNEWTYFDYIPEFSHVNDLKLRIYMYTRIQPYKQKLYLMRKKMKEPKTIDEYGLIPEWYDINRPALLFLKYRDKCLEKLLKETADVTPTQSPEVLLPDLEPPEILAPPSTPISETVKPVVVPKKGKEKPAKVGSGGKAKDGLESVPSKSDKRKDQGDTNNVTSKSLMSSIGSNGKKGSKTIAARKRLKSLVHPAPLKLKNES